MSSKIRKCVRELERGEEIDVLLPEYAKQYMIAQDSLSRIRMMMEYYMFYEMISEGLNLAWNLPKRQRMHCMESLNNILKKEPQCQR